jgi:hypothetical protein
VAIPFEIEKLSAITIGPETAGTGDVGPSNVIAGVVRGIPNLVLPKFRLQPSNNEVFISVLPFVSRQV